MSQPAKPPVRIAHLVAGPSTERRMRQDTAPAAERGPRAEPTELDTLNGELEVDTLHDLAPIDRVTELDALARATETLRPCPPRRPSGIATLTSYLEDTSTELAEARAALEDLEAYARLPWWRRLFTVPRTLQGRGGGGQVH